ncbi:MAG: hypothetical protein H6815_10685 [Phycisphaeraceae bacterium]|nr:hypothetical protein [Phycisphaerales bacterium]MCB9860903.1 hypothetical protein [Phycisphaeraceae bacterium]
MTSLEQSRMKLFGSDNRDNDAGTTPPVGTRSKGRVLVVTGRKGVWEFVNQTLSPHTTSIVRCGSVREAIVQYDPDDYVLLIVDAKSAGCMERAAEVATLWPGIGVAVLMVKPGLEDSLAAVRGGVIDVIDRELAKNTIATRLIDALNAGRSKRTHERHIDTLWALCGEHGEFAQDNAEERPDESFGALVDGLVDMFDEMSLTLDTTKQLTEFQTLLRQELDLEGVLRTALQQLLACVGACNTAVFLPGTSGDFSLGAYVNNDLNPEHLDMLLDEISDAVGAHVDHLPNQLHLRSASEIQRELGISDVWMGDRQMLLAPCRADGEVLAVVAFFQDQQCPFSTKLVELIEPVATLVGSQLARVVRVHHRHLPKDKWGSLTEPHSLGDDFDIAA